MAWRFLRQIVQDKPAIILLDSCAAQQYNSATQRELVSLRSPPWAFPPLTWAAGSPAALFSAPTQGGAHAIR
jgi:hypothetical protein